MDDGSTRLEKALMLYMEWASEGEALAAEDFLCANEEYRDLLQPMLEDEPVTDAEPTRSLGEYRILREIGRGGMGVVYEAEQAGLARRVALKVLPAHMTLDETTVLRFQREARLAARLEHSGIVAVHGVGKDKDAYYFAMDFVPGISLAECIQQAATHARTRQKAEPGDLATSFGSRRWIEAMVERIAQVADALQHAHEQGILHRDVKPSNILIREDGSPVLTDFGLAREEGLPSMTLTGDFAGTPYYVSPEQAQGRTDLDVRTDLFSLGVTLYEVLTLHRPFEGSRPQEVIQKITSREPTDPRKHGVDLPPDLRAILEHALEKDRTHRYQSAAEMAADLRAFLAWRPVSARRASTSRRLVRWARRNPVVALLSGALMVTLIVGFVLTLKHNRNLSRSLAETRLLLDARVVHDFANNWLKLEASKPEHAASIRTWIHGVEELIAREGEYRRMLAPGSDLALSRNPALKDSLATLQEQLQELGQPQTGKLAIVRTWLATVESIQQRSIEDAAAAWKVAIADISREGSPYHGLRIEPQVGLVPIGKDPQSGFWEFAHLPTGEPAERNNKGRLLIHEETGLVFVLLPGGKTRMGARLPKDESERGQPYVDPMAAGWESPVNEVELSPFFLSKFEITQGQWIRILGENPSYFAPGRQIGKSEGRIWKADLRHPAEMFHWIRAKELMHILGFSMPTEAQWEYGARGGTTTTFWTGNDSESLRGAENLADKSLQIYLPQAVRGFKVMDYDDGFARHGPVGSMRPNPFGLYDMLGNVAEFTGGHVSSYKTPVRAGDAQRPYQHNANPIIRGAGFMWPPSEARASFRDTLDPWSPAHSIGLRPARALH